MLFDLTTLSGKDTYKLLASTIVPRPIAWITTLNDNGTVNAAPFSFFNVLSGDPPVVGIGISHRADGRLKDTAHNIAQRPEWVINLVSAALADKMNITASDFPSGVSETEKAEVETVPCSHIATPRIVQSPVALECRLMQKIDLDPRHQIFLGKVIALHVDDRAVLDATHHYLDSTQLDLIGRMQSPNLYVRTTDLFEMSRLPVTPT